MPFDKSELHRNHVESARLEGISVVKNKITKLKLTIDEFVVAIGIFKNVILDTLLVRSF